MTFRALAVAMAAILAHPVLAQEPPKGEIKGSAWAHTPDSLAASVQDANVVLPAVAF